MVSISPRRGILNSENWTPERLFWLFAATHLLLWTIVPALTSPNLPLDVIEGYAWGREWLLGTYKHPPMQAWWLEILAIVTGRAAWASFFASQVCVVVSFWAVWQTARRMMSDAEALVGVLLLEGIIYYNFTSPEFNPNVLQLMFWALAGRSFHRAVKDNRLTDWFLLGLWGAGGMYSKYSTALLLATFGVLLVIRPEVRRRLRSFGPYLALLVTTSLFLPHALWIMQHDYLPFTYVKERLQAVGPATKYFTPPDYFPSMLMSPLVFVVGQILALLPASLLFLVLDGKAESNPAMVPICMKKFDRVFLSATTFAPTLLTLGMSMVFGFKTHDMWGAPFFNFAGLWAISAFYPQGVRISLRFVVAWCIVFVAALCGLYSNNVLAPYINQKPQRILFPGEALANAVSAEWHQRYAAPLTYVVGNTWAAGNVAYYAPDRPHLFIEANTIISSWIDTADLREKGGVVVWCQQHCSRDAEGRKTDQPEPDYLKEQFPDALHQQSLILPRQTDADLYPVTIGWAIIPPQKAR